MTETTLLTTQTNSNIIVSNTHVASTDILDAYELTDRIYDDRHSY